MNVKLTEWNDDEKRAFTERPVESTPAINSQHLGWVAVSRGVIVPYGGTESAADLPATPPKPDAYMEQMVA